MPLAEYSVAGACLSFGHASNGPDFDTDLSRDVESVSLIRFRKFDLALFQRLVQSSQTLAASSWSSAMFVVASGPAVTFRIFERR
jgi:hypothetical protein